MEPSEVIDILSSVIPRLGNDEDIEAVSADITTAVEYLSGVQEERTLLNDDVSRLNIKVAELQKLNNKLFRQAHVKDEIDKKAQQEKSAVDSIIALV